MCRAEICMHPDIQPPAQAALTLLSQQILHADAILALMN